jgi:hypothetical protein
MFSSFLDYNFSSTDISVLIFYIGLSLFALVSWFWHRKLFDR